MSDLANTSHIYPEWIVEMSSTNEQPGRRWAGMQFGAMRHAQPNKTIVKVKKGTI